MKLRVVSQNCQNWRKVINFAEKTKKRDFLFHFKHRNRRLSRVLSIHEFAGTIEESNRAIPIQIRQVVILLRYSIIKSPENSSFPKKRAPNASRNSSHVIIHHRLIWLDSLKLNSAKTTWRIWIRIALLDSSIVPENPWILKTMNKRLFLCLKWKRKTL